MIRTTPYAWAGTIAAAALFLWAAYGLTQQDARLLRSCQAAGAPVEECRLRIAGR